MADLSDLEITRLCAQAMGISSTCAWNGTPVPFDFENSKRYTPLTDDAQAMALVERFRLALGWDYEGKIWCEEPRAPFTTIRDAADLNRAICLCVAKMQQAKAER